MFWVKVRKRIVKHFSVSQKEGVHMTPNEFRQQLADSGIQLSPQQVEQFHYYFQLLVEWNVKMN